MSGLIFVVLIIITRMSSVAPRDWEEVYHNIEVMREGRTAPVDRMGARRTVDLKASKRVQRFQCLVSLILSSQTKDEVIYTAMMRLREHGLTVENLLATSEEELGQMIYPVGFWRNKARYLLQTSGVLADKYEGDIPSTVEELCELAGVGPKVAHLVMNIAWGLQEGIGVDTHVHRISQRLGWVDRECNTPEKTRVGLEAWLPREKWEMVNWLLVGFGQEICLPNNPQCGQCLNRNLCPTGLNWKKTA